MPSHDALAGIPFLGSGLGFRRPLKKEILSRRDAIDFLEIITEQYTETTAFDAELEEICDAFPVMPHGIRMSVGSMQPLDRDHLRKVKRVVDITDAPFYSEHLCMTKAPGIDIGHLSPLWFTEEVLQRTIENVHLAQDVLERPLVLENVTYLFDIPNPQMPQTEFFHRLVDETGCGILLDVTNVYINGENHGQDGERFLADMPMEHVVQLHIAGGFWSNETLIDSHNHPVEDGTWDLLETLAGMEHSVKGSILEHDSNFPEDFGDLLSSLERTREIMGWHPVREKRIA